MPAGAEHLGGLEADAIGRAGDPVNVTGWVFKATFERYAADPEAFTLDMAADPADEGFRVFNGPSRQITCRILADTLAALPDTTGDLTLVGDLLATPPGSDRFFIADLEFTVLRGPTA